MATQGLAVDATRLQPHTTRVAHRGLAVFLFLRFLSKEEKADRARFPAVGIDGSTNDGPGDAKALIEFVQRANAASDGSKRSTEDRAGRVIQALTGVAKTVIQTIARIITAITSGRFGLDTFLDICRTVGGAVLEAVLVRVGEAVVGAVADAAGAVVDFVASLW